MSSENLEEHKYSVELSWDSQNKGTLNSDYSRNYSIGKGQREVILGSNGKTFGGPDVKYDPEMLLLAGLTSCYHLSYIYLLNRNKIDLISYEDNSTLTLVKNKFTFEITQANLYPKIKIASENDLEEAKKLIPVAKKVCFVGQSLKIPYYVEPEITTN
ncbi:organic hydroperoxide reductase OsmC/OhrA [Mycoplasma testudineum]|uniref:Organic hydroperoxide reductase OsmC/OhrA n=1 Tax=Mycoplasma testudineum TaxID=244584 RepID=A0A4R6IFH6_9MOLU|nr:OsmC family protein [Mycoplasma testudineum]OYD26932.1 hypothetical protein CG473_01165 [Mycoplasma testudineum]TDO20481.1 organic hydroperoxide reductase OsmC/OhrA [Mycoplasma testudineum]